MEKHITSECKLFYSICTLTETKGIGKKMIINTDNLISIEEVNQDFSKVTHRIDENGMAIILKENKPYCIVTDFAEYETIQEIQKLSTDKSLNNITAYNPYIEIDVEQYRKQHPLLAFICYDYVGTRKYKKKNEGWLLFEGSVSGISLLYKELFQFGRKEYQCFMPEYWLEQMKKIFKAESKEMVDILSEPNWSKNGKILSIFDVTSYKYCDVVFFGQLKTLFGEPLYTTDDVQNQYSYCISATGKDNNTIYFDVYAGPSGPAIGGGFFQDNPKVTDEDINKMAHLLISYILQAKPTDYDYEGIYENDIIIKEGIKNGCPYYKEEEIKEETLKIEELDEIEYYISAVDENNKIANIYIQTIDNSEPSEQVINYIIQDIKKKKVSYNNFTLIEMGIKNGCPFCVEKQIYDFSEETIHKSCKDK